MAFCALDLVAADPRALLAEMIQQLASFGRIVSLAWGKREGYGRSSIRDNQMNHGKHNFFSIVIISCFATSTPKCNTCQGGDFSPELERSIAPGGVRAVLFGVRA